MEALRRRVNENLSSGAIVPPFFLLGAKKPGNVCQFEKERYCKPALENRLTIHGLKKND